jgi:hypothetical protein
MMSLTMDCAARLSLSLGKESVPPSTKKAYAPPLTGVKKKGMDGLPLDPSPFFGFGGLHLAHVEPELEGPDPVEADLSKR